MSMCKEIRCLETITVIVSIDIALWVVAPYCWNYTPRLSRSLKLGSRNVCSIATYRSDVKVTERFPSSKRYTKFRNCASHITRSLWSWLLMQLERWMWVWSLVRRTAFVRESIPQSVWFLPQIFRNCECTGSSFILGHLKDFYFVGFMRHFLEICSLFFKSPRKVLNKSYLFE